MILTLVLCFLAIQGVMVLAIPFESTRLPDVMALSSMTCTDSDANRRSLSGIIWSCLKTIFACTALAIHPNIPAPDEGFIRVNLVRRLKIMVVGLIAPELIITWAMRQWFMARLLAKRYEEYHWTQTHGFFALMGGFAISRHDGTQHPISLHNLEGYLREGCIKITVKEIEDRSKGDILSKGFLLAQTGWFILQLLARVIQRLPVTELEIVTLAFALLSFTIYGVWWNKPLEVQCSIVLMEPGSNVNGSNAPEARQALGEADRALEEVEPLMVPCTAVDHASQEIIQVSEEVDQASEGANSGSERVSLASEGVNHIPGTHPEEPTGPDMFSKAAGGMMNGTMQLFNDLIAQADAHKLENFFTDNQRVPTFYWGTDLVDDTYESFGRHYMRPLVALAGTIFGVIHCLAWLVEMPSKAEKILWLIAAGITTVMPLPFIIATVLAGSRGFSIIPPTPPSQPPTHPDTVKFKLIAAFILYAIARISLLVQAFVLLRALPEGAYTEVQWDSFMPHI